MSAGGWLWGGCAGGGARASKSTSESESVKVSQSASVKSVNMHALLGVVASHANGVQSGCRRKLFGE